jgi:hypothetical protein
MLKKAFAQVQCAPYDGGSHRNFYVEFAAA